MAERNNRRDQPGQERRNDNQRSNEGGFNQQGIPSNREQASEEGGSFRGEGSYGYQGGYDEEGEEREEEEGEQRANAPEARGGQERHEQRGESRSGYETGYQGGRGGEYPNYGDEGSFGGASDQRSAYGPTSGTRDRDKAGNRQNTRGQQSNEDSSGQQSGRAKSANS